MVSQTLEEMKVLELYNQNQTPASIYFGKIIANKNSDIQITGLSFSSPSAGRVQLLVSGVSKNRDGLVTFVNALKAQAGFADVPSPISNLAKDSDISFTLNIGVNL